MKAIAPLLASLALSGASLCAKTHESLTLTSEVFAAAQPVETDHSPKAMVLAAEKFLGTLSPEQRELALLPLRDPERGRWTNVPPSAKDGGLRLGDLNKEQLESASAFLSTILSKEGYLKVRNIMLADDLLLNSKEQAEQRGGFGAANYWVVLFGTPSETEPWAVQIDGHHLAVNLTLFGDKASISPSFIGTQPHRFTLGDEEIVPMGEETSLAFEFINSLDEEQRKAAIQGDKRGSLLVGAGQDGLKPVSEGLNCGSLTAGQRVTLMQLIALWVDDLPETAAKARLREIEAQLAETTFAWHGPYKPGSDASYHIYGPGLIIEYSGQDLGGDPLDHLHSIYRDPTNEYGMKWIDQK